MFKFLSANLMKVLTSYAQSITADKIIVSICAGQAGTKMQGSSLCLCLDSNKRALYNGAVTARYLHRYKTCVFFCRDMGSNMEGFLQKIHRQVTLPVYVLFQHPSPQDCVKLKLAGQSCLSALEKHYIECIDIVYDVHINKNCWTYLELVKTLTGQANGKDFYISNETMICHCSINHYHHPLFGNFKRTGWALVKQGNEMAFS